MLDAGDNAPMPIEDRALRHLPFVHGIENARLLALAAIATERTIPPETVVTRPGTPANAVFIVLDGRLHGEIIGPGGRVLLLDRLGPGDVFGELAALDGGMRLREVRSVSPARVAVIGVGDFNAWLDDTPAAARAMLGQIVERVRVTSERLLEMTLLSVERRVRLWLVRELIAAGQMSDGGLLSALPTRRTIARELGTTREAVSRALSQMAQDGLIDAGRRRIVVLDARALEPGAEGGDRDATDGVRPRRG